MAEIVTILTAIGVLVTIVFSGFKLIKYIKCCNCFEIVSKTPKATHNSEQDKQTEMNQV